MKKLNQILINNVFFDVLSELKTSFSPTKKRLVTVKDTREFTFCEIEVQRSYFYHVSVINLVFNMDLIRLENPYYFTINFVFSNEKTPSHR